MNKQTALIFYILSAYVVIQFIWWGYHLIELTSEINTESHLITKRITMIIGEGAVFLLLLLVGIWQIRRSILKDLKLSQRQKNFLLSITHELKTPLAANKLYIQTIHKHEMSREQVNELLDKAIDENVRLERMIDNILNASRLENKALIPQKENFPLFELMQQCVDRFRGLNKNANLLIECDPQIELNADRFMVETILGNLIENALKYAGGSEITVYAEKIGEQTVFGVRDGGPGIDRQYRNDIFQKFYRVGNEDTRAQKGTGLGLYIVQQLVKIHGGTISCRDNSPRGVDFQITL